MNEICISGAQLSSREVAIFVWLIILFLWAIRHKSVRKSLLQVCGAFLNWKIFVLIIATFIYSSLVILFLYNLKIWEPFLIKDTIYWFIGTAFVLLINSAKATQKKGFFKKVFLDNLKAVVLLEFIVNFYTLNIFAELLLVPILFILGGMHAMTETKIEYTSVKKLLDLCISVIGTFFIVYALANIIGDYQGFITMKNIKTFALPPILTAAFIPFIYLFALFIAYENLFVRLGFFIKNNHSLLRFAKIKIFQHYHFNLPKLNAFAQKSSQDLIKLNSKKDVLQMIKKSNQ